MTIIDCMYVWMYLCIHVSIYLSILWCFAVWPVLFCVELIRNRFVTHQQFGWWVFALFFAEPKHYMWPHHVGSSAHTSLEGAPRPPARPPMHWWPERFGLGFSTGQLIQSGCIVQVSYWFILYNMSSISCQVAVLYMMRFGSTVWSIAPWSKPWATCQADPSSQAFRAALKVMTFGCLLLGRSSCCSNIT